MKTRTKGNSSFRRINHHITKFLVTISRNNNIHILNYLVKRLITFLRIILQFKKDTVHLVHHQNGFNSFRKGLAQHSLRLHTNTLHTINNDKSAVSHTESSSNFRSEINMPRRINQVHQITFSSERVKTSIVRRIKGWKLVIQGDTSRLDGDSSLLLFLVRVSKTTLSSLGSSDHSGFRNQRISQSGLAVINVGNNTHVSYVFSFLHLRLHLLESESHHGGKTPFRQAQKTCCCCVSLFFEKSKFED
mmetsp:Transcript_14448/g.20081  ORF Transcript_14448/g.20081 Transcript_14448/m.20081 type:complete len:247 (-) Transcript_14448:97-837(-)